MIKFLIKSLGFIIFAAVFLWIVFSAENGNADAFHLKLATPKQSSLIIGNSKAAQAINPDILNQELADIFHHPIFNFSFGFNMSSYGPVYLESIKDKLDPHTEGGIYIIAVDPQNIIAPANHAEDYKNFPDTNLPLAHVSSSSAHPNIDYMLNWFPYPYFEILWRRWRPANEVLHSNGWLEVTVPMDESSKSYRLSQKVHGAKQNIKEFKLSEVRVSSLRETISFLQSHGKVYLVRIPSHPEVMVYEHLMVDDFDKIIDSITHEFDIPYLDLSIYAADYEYVDGLHMYKGDVERFTLEIAKWIKSLNVQ